MRLPSLLLLAGCAGAPNDSGAPAGDTLATLRWARQIADQGLATYDPAYTLLDWIPTVWAWGLHRTYAASADPRYQDWYRTWMDKTLVGFEPDDFVSSDSTSPALIAATLMWEEDSSAYTTITDAADAYIASVPRVSNGAMVHWGPLNPWGFPSDQVWVDSQFMLGLFLLREGERTGDRDHIDSFVEQYTSFSELLRDPEDGLYRHAWDEAAGENIPSDDTYWARGNAWALISGAELLRTVGPEDPAWAVVAPLYAAHLEAVLALQAEDGLWCTVLNRGEDPLDYTETSASALIGYATVVGLEAGAPIDEPAARAALGRAVAGLEARLSEAGDGTLHLKGTSTGTNPGSYEDYLAVPQVDDLLLGWGSVAMFLAEADGIAVP